jgi:glucose/arabinose dehydrogenase
MALHPDTGLVWQNEHGPKGGDEVNIVRTGKNYGWPVITYGEEYSGGPVGDGLTHKEGMEQPLVHWEPSIAPSGMLFYTGNRFKEWKGDLFIGALSQKHLRRLELNGETVVHQEELLKDVVGRIRDVAQGPKGYIWLITDADNGKLYRLEPR